MNCKTVDAFLNPGTRDKMAKVLELEGLFGQEKNQECLEPCLEKAEEILKKVRRAKDPAEIQRILPSLSVLNRLHSTVSSLLAYHH